MTAHRVRSRSSQLESASSPGIAFAGASAAYTYLVEPLRTSRMHLAPARPGSRGTYRGNGGRSVVGGAVGKEGGDRDITTTIGAAAGALIGRKIREEIRKTV